MTARRTTHHARNPLTPTQAAALSSAVAKVADSDCPAFVGEQLHRAVCESA